MFLREKQAVPVLIELLAVLPRHQAWPVLELLKDMAGVDAPITVAGANAAERGRCRDAWAAWWKAKGNRLDLDRTLTEAEKRRPKGHTLLVQLGLGSFSGQVVELEGPIRCRAGRLTTSTIRCRPRCCPATAC